METVNKKVEIAKLFSEVNKIIKRSMRKSFDDVGITIPQSLVIGTLTQFGEMKISELSRKINLSNSTISGILDRLEKRQLVIRTRSEEDRRIVYVKVSPNFGEIHKEFHEKVEQSFEHLLSAGTPEEIGKIVEGLNTFKKILND
ncbi:MAG: MarR family transcriptional regulator [Desulfotomaculaceae bacterium]|nr:MarR family transcriptional regulator [Desulfotomaculaceae bacterium]